MRKTPWACTSPVTRSTNHEGEIRRFARQRIIDLKPARDTQTVAGMIIALRVMKNKKGDKMGFITLDDRSGRIEASLFADAFHSAQSLLQTDAMVVVEGEVSNDDFSGGLRLRVKRVMSMEDARTNLAESLRLSCRPKDLKGDQLRWLGELFKRHRGACPITMDVCTPRRQGCVAVRRRLADRSGGCVDSSLA